jgi:hypothetical protein
LASLCPRGKTSMSRSVRKGMTTRPEKSAWSAAILISASPLATARDLGARPLVEVHVHARVRGDEGREDFGQEFRRSRGVGEQPHVSFQRSSEAADPAASRSGSSRMELFGGAPVNTLFLIPWRQA